MAASQSASCDIHADSDCGSEAMDETTWIVLPHVDRAPEQMAEVGSTSVAPPQPGAGQIIETGSCTTNSHNSRSADGGTDQLEGQAAPTSMGSENAWLVEPIEKPCEEGAGQYVEEQPSFGSCEVVHPQLRSLHASDEEVPLDELSFRHFAPLLKASQAYAVLSGCRFRSNSFDGLTDATDSRRELTTISSERSRDPGPRLAAKLVAVPLVRDFTERLLANEPPLVEELERAHRVVMSESIRNSMISTCQEYNMFPPAPPPRNIEDEDCAYQDTSAPFPVIAQRLYNDQVQRLCGIEGDETEAHCWTCPPASHLQRRAMTSAFIVDFATDAGVVIPSMPEAFEAMLKEFSLRVEEWSCKADRGTASGNGYSVSDRIHRTGAELVAEGSAAAERWFPEFSTKQHKHPLLYAAGAVALGAAAVASTSIGRRIRT